MVTLPTEFVAISIPGYFWNLRTKTLFSIKVTGTLKELLKPYPCKYNNYHNGYIVSHKGLRRYIQADYLNKLVATNSEIPLA